MRYVVCEHDLTHQRGAHVCDGCCAKYLLLEDEDD